MPSYYHLLHESMIERRTLNAIITQYIIYIKMGGLRINDGQSKYESEPNHQMSIFFKE